MSISSSTTKAPSESQKSPFGPPSAEAVRTRIAKMADAAWALRAQDLVETDPEYSKYKDQYVAVLNQRIVAYGENYTEVLHRAAAECGVKTNRVVVDCWGDPATLQSESVNESDHV